MAEREANKPLHLTAAALRLFEILRSPAAAAGERCRSAGQATGGARVDERREVVEIDLSSVTTPSELQRLLARSLDFPDFYGHNWAAFWDAITGLVGMPRRLRLVGWAGMAVRLPDESRHLRECLADAAAQYSQWSAVVEYA